jgi:hypothetical protein
LICACSGLISNHACRQFTKRGTSLIENCDRNQRNYQGKFFHEIFMRIPARFEIIEGEKSSDVGFVGKSVFIRVHP